MIQGTVPQARNAFTQLTVIGPSGRRCRIQAMIDTGFDGEFTLPTSVIRLLQLPWKTRGRAEMADGSVAQFDVYDGTILWDRKRRPVLVNETDSMPLVGISLMEGYALNIQFRVGGKLTLLRISR